MNLRTWAKKTPPGRLFWRLFIGSLGGGITVLGAIFLVAPGPGVLVLLAGLGILATEFAWAGRAIERTKSVTKTAADKLGLPLRVKYFIVAGGAVVSIIAVLIYHWR